MIRETGTKGFLVWLQRALPKTYRVVKKDLQQSAQLSGIGLIEPTQTANETPMSSSLATTLKELAQVAAQTYLTKEQIDAQQKILNIQLQRAQQGLAPLAIDPTTYGLPSPSIGVGLTGDTQKTLLYIAGGFGVLLLFKTLMGGRRAR